MQFSLNSYLSTVSWETATKPQVTLRWLIPLVLISNRSICLLNEMNNITVGSIFIPILKLVLFEALFISTYATVEVSFASDCFWLLSGIDAQRTSTHIPERRIIMSEIFNLSSQFHIQQAQQLHCLPSVSRQRIRRQLKSFPTLDCQVGPLYHKECKAKLTIADNMTQGIAFMLLQFNCRGEWLSG